MSKPSRTIFHSKILLLILLLSGVFTKSFAQDMYGSMKGVISMVGIHEGSTITATSKKLQITLDYEHAIFEMVLPINTLYTGIDYLDGDFQEMEEMDITLKAQLGIDHINTNQHPTQYFTFKAIIIQREKEIEVTGTGHLEHVDGVGEYACLLGIKFELNPDALNLGILGHSRLNIQVRQTVLNRLDKGY